MSRTGPGYVETEEELFADLDHKRERGDISDEVAGAFLDLYELAKELGDRVEIGGAKNAHFRLKVADHRGSYDSGNPSVFTANVTGKLKVWPARMPIDHNYMEYVSWQESDYRRYEQSFQSLTGVPSGGTEAPFEVLVSGDNFEQFERAVREFVSSCRTERQ